MLNSISDIVDMHKSEGNVEDAYQRINFDNKTFLLNKYTLSVRRGNMSKDEARMWNVLINNEIKRDRSLYKEIREFKLFFHFLNRFGIKSGHIEKTESPDFVFTKNNKQIGIEMTKIYVGNDWIAEKITEEIKAVRKRKDFPSDYKEYAKFHSKIISFQIREGILIMPPGENEVSIDEYITEIKNKIFQKIRKLIDEYKKFEKNIIFAEIASPRYFTSDDDIRKLSEELKFYISHLDGFYDDKEYELILKASTKWARFNLISGEYEII